MSANKEHQDPDMKKWLRTLTEQELYEFRLQCEKAEDDESEELVMAELGRRAFKKYTNQPKRNR